MVENKNEGIFNETGFNILFFLKKMPLDIVKDTDNIDEHELVSLHTGAHSKIEFMD